MRKLFFVGLASLTTLGFMSCGDDDDSSSGGACAIKVSDSSVLCMESSTYTETICDSIEKVYQSYGMDSVTTESMSSCPGGSTESCSDESSGTIYVYDSNWNYCISD